MTTLRSDLASWRLCVAVCLGMVLLSLIPQLHLWWVRGHEWNGAYVSPQGDELLYSGYLNALINGRARKNDPFGATDSSPGAPLPESIFSLQFLPAYAVALPARTLGVSASKAFIILIAVAAFLASLAVFWLLKHVSGDHRLAAAGTLFVLCFGCLVGRNGIFGTFLDIGPSAFPFLRRYQPAVAFPLFYVFQLMVWRALESARRSVIRVTALLAGLTLALLIFSHLYLWTAAAAWLSCLGVLWLYLRPGDRRKMSLVLIIVVFISLFALAPYAYLIFQRASTLDQQQIMIYTRKPDLLRLHEVIGAAILASLLIGVARRRFERSEPRVIYTGSLALLPFIVFNQQMLTGRTMQAFHFEVAVVNYSTLVGVMLTINLFRQRLPRRFLLGLGGLSLAFAVFLVALPARLVFVPQAIASDRSVPVLLRLKDLSTLDGTLADLRAKGQASTLVFSPSVALIALLPTWTSQGTLLDMTGVDCRALSREERKRFFYMHLYYSNVDIDALRQALNGKPDRTHEELASVQTAIFGYERTSPALTPEFRAVEANEVEREVQAYQTYANEFSRAEALSRPLTYAVIPAGGNSNTPNLDRWYERDVGEGIGAFTLYRLKLRN